MELSGMLKAQQKRKALYHVEESFFTRRGTMYKMHISKQEQIPEYLLLLNYCKNRIILFLT